MLGEEKAIQNSASINHSKGKIKCLLVRVAGSQAKT